jgi:hypothetical protein
VRVGGLGVRGMGDARYLAGDRYTSAGHRNLPGGVCTTRNASHCRG